MPWIKKGLIFKPDNLISWMKSHCQLPVAMHLELDVFRVFFATRNENQFSQIGFVDFNVFKSEEILNVSTVPVLQLGNIGTFDEHGVFPSCVVRHDDKIFLYYIGWNQGVTPPLFYASIGLAISNDGGQTFNKYSTAPIMQRSEFDPTLVTSPHVYIENGLWRMTYVSGIKWEWKDGALKSYYHIKYAESNDGIHWKREGIVAVNYKDEKETNIARSAVIKEDGIYKMWYSYVLPPLMYRIGYAESTDGKIFVRKDQLSGIDVSLGTFDSDMMCYPNIFNYQSKKYLLYNGNQYGKEGFGLAVWE